MEREEIYRLACDFRRAINLAVSLHDFDDDPVMCSFPVGCCGDTADLIGEYLLNNGLTDLWYVSGIYYGESSDDESAIGQTHAWISMGAPCEEDSLIIDITGDQFCGNSELECTVEEVYVGPMDRFHRLFRIEGADYYRFRGVRQYENSQYRLLDLYERVMKFFGS